MTSTAASAAARRARRGRRASPLDLDIGAGESGDTEIGATAAVRAALARHS
jgi:hypothetical protein